MSYRDWVRHANAVFHNYDKNKEELRQLIGDVAYGRFSAGQEPVSGKGISDPVGSGAVRLLSPRAIILTREVQAVERVREQIRRSGPKAGQLLDLYYREGKGLEGAAAALGISSRTAKRWKKAACLLLAQELGWE